MNLHFDIPKNKSSIIKVFGVGGGGSNAVNHMYRMGIKGVDFVICNTDSQALELSPVPIKIQIGNNLTEGRGAGSKPEVGEKAAQEDAEEIKKYLADNTKMVFITAGMGGGTGTGAAPVIAKIAKELGILTVGIVTKPFNFEGNARNGRAKDGIENLKQHVDTLLVIDNEKLRDMFGNSTFSAAFGQADNILATAAKGIAEIITLPGYINVDFEDVKTVMSNSGVAIMGCGLGEGEDRAIKAVEGALNSPLLSENDIHGASHILLNITSGTKEILMDEISAITSYIQEEAGSGADMIWGHCTDDSLEDKIMVTLIATGFEGKRAAQEPKVIHSLTEVSEQNKVADIVYATPVPSYVPQSNLEPAEWEPIMKAEELNIAPVPDSVSQEEFLAPVQAQRNEVPYFQAQTTEQRFSPEPKHNAVTPQFETGQKHEAVISLFKDEEEERESEYERMKRIQSISENSKTGKGLDELERMPAYIRKKIKLQNIPHSSESNISTFNLHDEAGEENVSIRQHNSFLHHNVD
jgi:cell division protein FtsZ